MLLIVGWVDDVILYLKDKICEDIVQLIWWDMFVCVYVDKGKCVEQYCVLVEKYVWDGVWGLVVE